VEYEVVKFESYLEVMFPELADEITIVENKGKSK
jgi:hypothetical protein